jgi:preprotein translocase subunit SecG
MAAILYKKKLNFNVADFSSFRESGDFLLSNDVWIFLNLRFRMSAPDVAEHLLVIKLVQIQSGHFSLLTTDLKSLQKMRTPGSAESLQRITILSVRLFFFIMLLSAINLITIETLAPLCQ